MATDDDGEAQRPPQHPADDHGDFSDHRLQNGDVPHSTDEDDHDSSRALPAPVWMRESSKSFRWRWVPLPLRKAGRAIANWSRGPQPPVELKIEPFFPTIQEWPLRVMDRFVPKRRHRILLLAIVYLAWFLPWALVLRHVSSEGEVPGYGKPNNIWCGATDWFVFHFAAHSHLSIAEIS